MENLVILAAIAATVIGCILMAGLVRAGRRPPLLLPQEEDWADDEAGTIRKLTPDRPSPIDRNAPVLDVEALEAKPLDPRALDAQMNLMFDRNRRPEPDAAGRQRRIG
ncbi:hypothetical protein HNR00_003170 [Methylorubrum rhodinum]|jgi:hypothetical protein|uniref:Uncharacterized protein n=1 Tax=Methylorubrum rhodinum TaxID=29428 RepID=A0A840ZN02_9HYPH|nr:hypothetical protein [Methylorubrum rhodinum]MBB5758448.1 hypothetical protein [Methylorubrum rhodinum]